MSGNNQRLHPFATSIFAYNCAKDVKFSVCLTLSGTLAHIHNFSCKYRHVREKGIFSSGIYVVYSQNDTAVNYMTYACYKLPGLAVRDQVLLYIFLYL